MVAGDGSEQVCSPLKTIVVTLEEPPYNLKGLPVLPTSTFVTPTLGKQEEHLEEDSRSTRRLRTWPPDDLPREQTMQTEVIAS